MTKTNESLCLISNILWWIVFFCAGMYFSIHPVYAAIIESPGFSYTSPDKGSLITATTSKPTNTTWSKPTNVGDAFSSVSLPAKDDSSVNGGGGKGDGNNARIQSPQDGGGGAGPSKTIDAGGIKEYPQQGGGGGTPPTPPGSAPQSQVVLIVYFDPSLDNPPNSGNYQGGSFSGGIPVGTYTVLTAGHSAGMMRPGDPRSGYTYGPGFGSNLGSGIAMSGDVDRIIYAPGSLDLAIVVFRTPIPGAHPVSVAPANSLQPGNTVQVLYENNLTASSSSIQVDSLGENSAPGYHGGMTWGNYPQAVFSTWQTPTAEGDSGFPVLNQSGQLVGVVHGEVTYPVGGSFDLFMNTTQPDIRQWIVNNANARPNSPPAQNNSQTAPANNNSATSSQANPAPQNNGTGGQYTVQSGDTLYRIATEYGISVDQLMQANGLTNSNIRTGESLTIPGGNFAASPNTAPPSTTNNTPVVQPTAVPVSTGNTDEYEVIVPGVAGSDDLGIIVPAQ